MHIRDSSGLYGAERVILTLGKNINHSKFNFILVGMQRSDANSDDLMRAARNFKIRVLSLKVRKRFDLTAILKLRKIIRRNRIHIIHTHDFKSDFYGWLSTLFLPVVRIATAHGSTRDSLLKKIYLFLTEKFLYRVYDKVVAVSIDLANFLRKQGLSHHKIVTIQNGIDREIINFSYTGEKLFLPFDSDKFIILGIIGRLYPDKGHLFFLDAFSSLQKKIDHLKSLIIGEGPFREVIQQKIDELGLSKDVILLGYQSNMHKIYSLLSLIIIPSLREGLPYTLLEAMIFKIPVVATCVGDIPTLIEDGKTGKLVPPGDSAALEKAIEAILSDPDKTNMIREQAYQRVSRFFSSEEMVYKTEKLYSMFQIV